MNSINKFLDNQFDKVSNKIKTAFKKLKSYIKRLLFPLYLFPVKLLTYSTYYLIKFLLKLIISIIKGIFNTIIYPFRSFKNLFKTFFWASIFLYFAFTEYRFNILVDTYGGYNKFFCMDWSTERKLKQGVLRIVGGYGEGSGFLIGPNQVLTNFHVIDGEPSPKVIFPDGHFETPKRITAYKDADLAYLWLNDYYNELVFEFQDPLVLAQSEPLLSAGYPYGTSIMGEPTILKGNFITYRQQDNYPVSFLHTDIDLVEGMSGGPLVDQCGKVVGINTLSISGSMSYFVAGDSIRYANPQFTDEHVTKIEVHPEESPEQAVTAFYIYLKARRMQDGFNLLSKQYLEKTDYKEWTSRFPDIIDVDVIKTEPVEGKKDTVFIKFVTQNWVNNRVVVHYYEGTWQTVLEDGLYKMNQSKIIEVDEPEWDWFYE
jgi:hypothetical protein